MKVSDLTTKRVGILGFGQEGQAVFEYLKKHGIEAEIFDQKNGSDYLNNLESCEVIFRSPGIRRKHPKILEAENNGTVITSQTKWFFEHSPAKIIGVTGTKGKGTTSSLIYETIKASGKKVFLTGNIGKVQPLEILDSLSGDDLIVFELSSFQLQDLTQSPQIGICLMVTSDHLNHHHNLEEYHSAKSAITAFQLSSDIAIYNADYPASKQIGLMGQGSKFTISAVAKPEVGAFIKEQTIYINVPGKSELIMDCSKRKLRGNHNLENIAASALACINLNIDPGIIIKTSTDFAGLEHRLQYVGRFDNIDYYNDSISTVPETTIAALNSFNQPIHLILGGSDKGLSYESLIEDILKRTNIASISLIGETGKAIKSILDGKNFQFTVLGPSKNFAEIISQIKSIAHGGDAVLLSPASASFDMFENYAQRGNEFMRLVKEINNA